jgi:protein SCO1/2
VKRAFIAGLLLAALSLAAGMARAGEPPELLKSPRPVDEFSLRDQDGRPFDLGRLKGHWSLVLLGYTNCPDVCPFTLANLTAIRTELASRVLPENLPQIVFLAVDPARDAPLLKEQMAYFNDDVTGITGDKREIDRLVRALDGFYRFDRRPGRDSYEVVHSAAVAVLNPAAVMVARLHPPLRVQDTALALIEIQQKRENLVAHDR